MKVKVKYYEGLNRMFRAINNIRRWTEIMTDPKYDEISKQTLNCILCFFLAKENERMGKPINWTRIVKAAIYRAFQKAYIFYDTPEHIYKEICEVGKIPYEKVMRETTHTIIAEETDEEFADFLEDCCNTYEKELYETATKIATYFEYKENETRRTEKGMYLYTSLAKYENIPGFKEILDNYEEVFRVCSKLRNQNRWSGLGYRVSCAVSGHLFDTAIFGYFNALEMGYSEKDAVKIFYIGIFHDVAETFTRDIPSPVKNGIEGFREATEKYELKKMKEEFYPKLPKYMAKKVKEVMMEEDANECYKNVCKVADYISAGSEIFRQMPDETWNNAMNNHYEKLSKTYKDSIGKNALKFFESIKNRVNSEFDE